MRVLIGADMSNLAETVRREIETLGYAADSVGSIAEAEDLLAVNHYDAIVLDEPPFAPALIQLVRIRGDTTPILVLLSPCHTIDERIATLNDGVDEIVMKPCDPRELVARVYAVVRRSAGVANGELRIADLVLDSARHTVQRAGIPIMLAAKEFAMLEYLVLHQGKVLSKERLAGAVWDGDADEHIHLVEVYISMVRRKIDRGATRQLIHTVKGVGYRMYDKE
jgi:two-component system, OmpR family, copper resistance phosphate regulon response regulator CusR